MLVVLMGTFIKPQSYDAEQNPYEALKRSLSVFDSRNKSLTVFRKMDYIFAGGNLQWFMQMDFGMAFLKDYTYTDHRIVENYRKKVTSKNETLRVVYTGNVRKDIIGQYPSAHEIFQIENVKIAGTPDLVVRFFLRFWPVKETEIGSYKYKEGVIAAKNLLGDRILLKGVKGRYEIDIVQGNMTVDYEKTWGINKKRVESQKESGNTVPTFAKSY